MSIVYLNQKYLPLQEAKISVLDRGFLFADGAYEVIPVYGGRLFRLSQHLQRLDNTLAGIALANPCTAEQWHVILERLVEVNGGGEQSVYLQVTRGAGEGREHSFPKGVEPTVFAMSSPFKKPELRLLEQGANVVTLEDIRWQHCHLKTIALLANVLMQQTAKDQGADEAILIRDGYATECSASNLFIVDKGVLITPPKSEHLLPGVTRDLILELARENNINYREQEIPESQLAGAEEIWISSSSKEIVSVTRLNGNKVGDGSPGPLASKMLGFYQAYKSRLSLVSNGAE